MRIRSPRTRDHGHPDAGDDYAVSKVPFATKRPGRDFPVLAMGAVTSVFVFALGGSMATSYGIATTVIAAVFGFVVGTVSCSVVAWHGSGTSMGVDAMSRGAGFGFLGSAVNLLAYALTWIAYAAFECSFIATAVHARWSAPPLWMLYLVSALVVVPLTWYGVSQIAWLQWATVPLFFIGVAYLLVKSLGEPVAGTVPIGVTLPALAQASAIPLSIVPILSLALGDYGRFVMRRDRRWAVPAGAALMMALWVLEVVVGAVITARTGSVNPGEYSVELMGVTGLLWVIVTQLKVQFVNYYGSSVALTNFSARLLRLPWGRRAFLLLTGLGAFLVSLFDVIGNLGYVAGLMGVPLTAWLSLLLTDFVARRGGRERLGTTWTEHRRAYLIPVGWPEVIAMVAVSSVAIALVTAHVPGSYDTLVPLLLAWFLPPPLAWALRRIGWFRSTVLATSPGADWRDEPGSSDEDSDAQWNKVVCVTCGKDTFRYDAVQIHPSGTARCFACDEARPHLRGL
ncbi:purine-cytosine permease family protein [Streptomyces sp. NPDC057253]|uniref:purine-cytosine permease family protein n=1 Tax=Streptomyces sp. NPDC057253 TaxID=3346069 RepID=UPI00362EA1A7